MVFSISPRMDQVIEIPFNGKTYATNGKELLDWLTYQESVGNTVEEKGKVKLKPPAPEPEPEPEPAEAPTFSEE